ncbi:ATP-binding cassette domain-containing protein [Kiritimatiellota bacterium B12222]|nr:ATP-binding cassette domain-containing protein [Kiritimatiellota bacterium B12222]
MNSPRMELKGVYRHFETPSGNLQVLQDVNLQLFADDRIVLFGPSGCGKTTLLHLLALLDKPSTGTLLFQGKDTAPLTEKQRCALRAHELGMVFQQFHILPHHSVRDNVRLRTRYLQESASLDQRCEQLLEDMGLMPHAEKPARFLSGGEKQRLCIARALLVQPSLFLADEPTGNLDANNAEKVKTLFDDISRQGAAMIIATHDERWLEFATRFFYFEQGQLKERPL